MFIYSNKLILFESNFILFQLYLFKCQKQFIIVLALVNWLLAVHMFWDFSNQKLKSNIQETFASRCV